VRGGARAGLPDAPARRLGARPHRRLPVHEPLVAALGAGRAPRAPGRPAVVLRRRAGRADALGADAGCRRRRSFAGARAGLPPPRTSGAGDDADHRGAALSVGCTEGRGGRAMTAELMSLLAPISETSPGGEPLRFDPIYDEIKRMREEDDPLLPVGVWQRKLKRADWSAVARLCSAALMKRTKDLQLAAWLTEAWLHLLGFDGLEQGMRLVAALCRDFWNDLYPSLDDGLDARLGPIGWMAEKLVLAVKSVPITAPAGEVAQPQAWKDWEASLYLANLPRSGSTQSAADEGAAAQAAYLDGAARTPAVRLAQLVGEISGALAAIDALDEVLLERCGEAAAPSLTPLRQPLLAIHDHLARLLAERGEGEGEASAPAVIFGVEEHDGPAAAPSLHAPSSSRAEAYQKLREAADFLLRTEPHSPVPYLVRRAIAWGDMSLSQLLEELLARNADLSTIDTLLGIKRTAGR